ncbi:SU10 major capsid protein [Pyruvatibacter mobilis]|uniref:SU10 major capsid protein n=1 Tax=Pyruvatibacter mobilis TaxID=1712261 RepID=UPI003BAD5E3B
MTQYTSYDTVGQKEEVDSTISNISPTKTPFQSTIGNEKIGAKLFEWQEDSLADPRDNKAVEGFTATTRARTPTVMRENVTQILEDTFGISGTTDAVKHHGRKRETAYQLAKVGAQLKRDLEYAMVGTGQVKSSGSAAAARTFAGVQAQIDASVTVTAPDGDAGTAGVQESDLTEALVLEANQKLYAEGAEADMLMVKPTDSLKVADFANSAGRTREIGNERKVVNVVDLYVSPFGQQKVVLNRWIRETDALLYDPNMWKQCTLRPWFRETLAKTGDSTEIMVVGEFSLKHRNYKGTALITNLK